MSRAKREQILLYAILFALSLNIVLDIANFYADNQHGDYCRSIGYDHAIMLYDGAYCEKIELKAISE